jgi:hypothetical protein
VVDEFAERPMGSLPPHPLEEMMASNEDVPHLLEWTQSEEFIQVMEVPCSSQGAENFITSYKELLYSYTVQVIRQKLQKFLLSPVICKLATPLFWNVTTQQREGLKGTRLGSPSKDGLESLLENLKFQSTSQHGVNLVNGPGTSFKKQGGY